MRGASLGSKYPESRFACKIRPLTNRIPSLSPVRTIRGERARLDQRWIRNRYRSLSKGEIEVSSSPDPRGTKRVSCSKVGYREIGARLGGYDDNEENFRAGDNVPLGWIVSFSSRKVWPRERWLWCGCGNTGRGQVLAGISAHAVHVIMRELSYSGSRKGDSTSPLEERKREEDAVKHRANEVDR